MNGAEPAASPWHATSRERLEAALDDLRARITSLQRGETPPPSWPASDQANALDRLVDRFGLTSFERDLLLLCAGYELDGRFGELLAESSGLEGSARPNFARALTLLEAPHWSALAPDGPLRRARLISAGDGPGLVMRSLNIEEAVLHELTGLPHLDERLRPHVSFLHPSDPTLLPASHRRAVQRLVSLYADVPAPVGRPVVHLVGGSRSTHHQIGAAAAAQLGCRLLSLDPASLPEEALANEELLEIWQRDAVLHDFALLVEPGDPEASAGRPMRRWIERFAGVVILTGEPAVPLQRPVARVDVDAPSFRERRRLWASQLGPLAESMDGRLDALVHQFPIDPGAISEVAAEVRELSGDRQNAEDALWRATRRRARGGLDGLAQRLEPVACWDDLVLPPTQVEVLRSIGVHVRRRSRVYDDWGFARLSRRGLGIGALFCGPSGTGKTMAAEVLARDLGLDLYRIDLSATVSKYIGQTEKNLRRLFEAAEHSGAILLFDEADAIFGRRSEVRDSHDRYANLEISYLLQRIESYRGLAILTTNLEKNVDAAFMRRLRFVVHFPFPDRDARREIWNRVFPVETPVDALDFGLLARLGIAGGNIRNIAISAAFRAAEADRPVDMADLAVAARGELAKGGQNLSENQLQRWLS